jgi:hypothetical protein
MRYSCNYMCQACGSSRFTLVGTIHNIQCLEGPKIRLGRSDKQKSRSLSNVTLMRTLTMCDMRCAQRAWQVKWGTKNTGEISHGNRLLGRRMKNSECSQNGSPQHNYLKNQVILRTSAVFHDSTPFNRNIYLSDEHL